jgi:ribosome-associated protein
VCIVVAGMSIPVAELAFSAVRSQGAGGQNVNKVATAIQLRFDIAASSLSAEHKQRLLTYHHHLISAQGVVIIKAQEHRTQELNRQAALARFRALISLVMTVKKKRLATKPSKRVVARRLEGKGRRGETKALRGKVRNLSAGG